MKTSLQISSPLQNQTYGFLSPLKDTNSKCVLKAKSSIKKKTKVTKKACKPKPLANINLDISVFQNRLMLAIDDIKATEQILTNKRPKNQEITLSLSDDLKLIQTVLDLEMVIAEFKKRAMYYLDNE